MRGYPEQLGPTLISSSMTRSSYEYVMRLIDLGAFEGPIGEMKVNATLWPVVDAMHTVLAGGKVELSVVTPGNGEIAAELKGRFEQASKEANQLNKTAGFAVSSVP